jgi:hypothetical protein
MGQRLVRTPRMALLGTLAALVSVYACSSSTSTLSPGDAEDAGNAEDAADAGSGQIGPAGGTVLSSDGLVKVEIPPGALEDKVTFAITQSAAAPTLTKGKPVGEAHLFHPDGQTFRKPVKVTFTLQGLKKGEDEKGVVAYTAPESTRKYQALPTMVEDATHVTTQRATSATCNSAGRPRANRRTVVAMPKRRRPTMDRRLNLPTTAGR